MISLNLSYTYKWQHKRFENFWQKPFDLLENLQQEVVDNAYLLPPLAEKYPFGIGCVTYSDFSPCISSYMKWGDGIAMGETYEFNHEHIKYYDGKFVYLGFINHWYGHIITDYSTRLYACINNNDRIPVFLIQSGKQDFRLTSAARRLFELLNIDVNTILFLSSPAKFENVLIPQQSYIQGKYYSIEYLDTWRKVFKNIKPTISNVPQKIFLSRTKYISAMDNKELGNELLDFLFKSAGYMLLYPEKETLDNQICYFRNAQEIAVVQGSCVHNLIFALDKNPQVYVVNKTYFMGPQFFDSCKLIACNPIFLDFYIAKYPVRVFCGPFLYFYNDLMKKFIIDKKIKIDQEHYYFSSNFAYDLLMKYEKLFIARKKINHIKSLMPSKPDDCYYFHTDFTLDFINNIIPNLVRHFFIGELVKSEIDYKNEIKNFRSMLDFVINSQNDKPFLLYDLHISNEGWTGYSLSGFPIYASWKSNTIEAIRIKTFHCNLILQYTVYYEDEKWQPPVSAGEIAGTTGKSKKIQGIRITAENLKSVDFTLIFRVLCKEWSPWRAMGESVINNDGFHGLELKIENLS